MFLGNINNSINTVQNRHTLQLKSLVFTNSSHAMFFFPMRHVTPTDTAAAAVTILNTFFSQSPIVY